MKTFFLRSEEKSNPFKENEFFACSAVETRVISVRTARKKSIFRSHMKKQPEKWDYYDDDQRSLIIEECEWECLYAVESGYFDESIWKRVQLGSKW